MAGSKNSSQNVCELLYSLSSLARTGWMIRGVPHMIAESVATHSFYSAVIALIIATKMKEQGVEINPEKAAVIALVHDIGEAYIGDIVKDFSRKIGSNVKEKIELEAVKTRAPKELVKYVALLQSDVLESKIAKLSENLATYIMSIYYKRLGFQVDDIMMSVSETISDMAEEFGLNIKNLLDILGCSSNIAL